MSDPLPTLGLEAQLLTQHEQDWDHGRFLQGFATRRVYRGPVAPAPPDPPPDEGDIWIQSNLSDPHGRAIYFWRDGQWRKITPRKFAGIRRRMTGSQTNIVSESNTWLDWNSNTAPGYNTNEFTAPIEVAGVAGAGVRLDKEGWYSALLALQWDTDVTGVRGASIWAGSAVLADSHGVPHNVGLRMQTFMPVMFFAAGTILYCSAFQNSGATRTIAGGDQTLFNIWKVGDP